MNISLEIRFLCSYYYNKTKDSICRCKDRKSGNDGNKEIHLIYNCIPKDGTKFYYWAFWSTSEFAPSKQVLLINEP